MFVSTIEATDPGQAFRDSFPAHLQGLFLTCLQRAVDTGREAHLAAQGRGANETTFGVGVYNFAVHELREAVRQQPELGIKVRMEQQAFRLRVGPYKVACYKVGEFAYENIWASFPNPGASHEMVVGQDRPQWLPGMAPNLEGLRTVVIAYMCNPETGLEAVYLCIPTKGSHQKITEWGYALPVWARSSDTATASIGDSTPESLPPEEHVESPVVVLKPRKETGS